MENNINFGEMQFNLPKNQSNVIKVIGVGGGGGNAVNHMYNKGIEGVDFVICNTDAQALNNSPVPIKIQLGASLTEGLGAGADPEIGKQSAEESVVAIESMLGTKTKMVFITVGMGGGTGTGAAPIIAKIAKEMGLLTVAVVTTPFAFEGKKRNEQAQEGITKLRDFVDSIIVINNNKLREVYGNLGFKSGFSKADEVLSTAAMGITNVITNHLTLNIDFRDARTVLENSGTAIMGSSKSEGANRAQEAITKSLDSPLLNDNKITGAKNVLLLIVSGTSEITIDEIAEINDYIQSEAKTDVNIIMGVGEDESLGESIEVTIVATGFNKEQQTQISTIESKKIVYSLDGSSKFVTDKPINKPKEDIAPKAEISRTEEPKPEEPKIVHQLDEEINKPLTLFDIEVNEPDLILEDHKIITETKINDGEESGFLGNEFLDMLSDVKRSFPTEKKFEESNLIPTSEIIKNIDVVYDEVIANLDEIEDEFIITQAISDIDVVDMEIVKPIEKEDQMTFVFDMPIEDKKENVHNTSNEMFIKSDLDEAKQIEVIDTEIVSEYVKSDLEEAKQIDVIDTEIVSEKKIYNLDDYLALEKTLDQAIAPKKEVVEELAPELKMETKIVANINEDVSDEVVEIDPLNSTISELRKRADERRIKMNKHNYTFKNKTKQTIDELEKQPAYKRNHVELDENPTSSNITRTSLETDGNDISFRTNNSFLHDNVD